MLQGLDVLEVDAETAMQVVRAADSGRGATWIAHSTPLPTHQSTSRRRCRSCRALTTDYTPDYEERVMLSAAVG